MSSGFSCEIGFILHPLIMGFVLHLIPTYDIGVFLKVALWNWFSNNSFTYEIRSTLNFKKRLGFILKYSCKMGFLLNL